MSTREAVPVIDLEAVERDREAQRALDAACREWGVFQLEGHGIDTGLVSRLHAQMRLLFALPESHKRALERSAANPWGFFDRELTGNRIDAKQIFDVGPPDGHGAEPQWPRRLPALRAAIEQWSEAMHAVAGRLLHAILGNLGVPQEPLLGGFTPRHSSFLRLNYYPPGARGSFGVHPHTDAGALTLLLQDAVPGLQLLRDGRWLTVAPRAGALVVNLGDIVQVWSNDRYAAPLHRVLGSAGNPRYSAAFFHNPEPEFDYAPLPAACGSASPRYSVINWGAFRAARAAGDFADLGEEIQVHHFRPGAVVPPVYCHPRS